MRRLPPHRFLKLDSTDLNFLSILVTDEEIKTALFDMAPLKAPASDGFHALFFQKQWDIIGTVVGNWVKKVFAGGNIDAKLNNTLIILIPKIQNPEDFCQFLPISQCTVLYKLVMKIIANRFKQIFLKIITQEQVRFIAGKNIIDNIIIAQEVIHSMKSSKSRKWMAIKIDLKKAYDHVQWDFIDVSLQAAGIPDYFRNVLWNGVPTPKFKPVRGIR
ncbi:LINE-1 reverse transcriptase isogeny [Gossypium australe]|uniref:LINE-1 reverse transcriptase isogeny n=1 Tax=Gossypium australe TaxID=47621 RepID=A0A5B6X9Z1_9ROSI|nr:LINE-1 reverse transcriptase isogeny [Gossypium australe]